MKNHPPVPPHLLRPVGELITDVGSRAVRVTNGYQSLVEFVGETTGDLLETLLKPQRFRWRDFLYYLGMCGSATLKIVASICFLIGMVLVFLSGFYMRDYGLEMLVADGVGYAVCREIGPLMVAIVATGRAGSAFAAEIATMKANEEIDALQTMGIRPGRYLVIPKLLALVIALPLLTVFGDLIAIIGGMLVSAVYMDIPMQIFWGRICNIVTPTVFVMGIFKSFVFAVLIALIGCRKGLAARANAQGVGAAATDAVVASVFAIVIADAIMATLFTLLRM